MKGKLLNGRCGPSVKGNVVSDQYLNNKLNIVASIARKQGKSHCVLPKMMLSLGDIKDGKK